MESQHTKLPHPKTEAPVTERPDDRPFRRVIVAVDASPQSWAALAAAIQLAASLDAALEGLFVEDVNLLHGAGTPFTREVGIFTATVRPLDSQQMERQLRALAVRIRRTVARTATQMAVTWSFRVRRGRVADELLAVVNSETDLLSLGRLGWPLTRRTRLGSTARRILETHRTPILLAQEEIRFDRPVVVVFDGSEQATRALDLAAHLVLAYESDLLVLIPAPEFPDAQPLREQAIQRLAPQHVQAAFQRIDRVEPAQTTTETTLVDVLHRVEGGLLILGQRYFAQLDDVACAVLLLP